MNLCKVMKAEYKDWSRSYLQRCHSPGQSMATTSATITALFDIGNHRTRRKYTHTILALEDHDPGIRRLCASVGWPDCVHRSETSSYLPHLPRAKKNAVTILFIFASTVDRNDDTDSVMFSKQREWRSGGVDAAHLVFMSFQHQCVAAFSPLLSLHESPLATKHWERDNQQQIEYMHWEHHYT